MPHPDPDHYWRITADHLDGEEVVNSVGTSVGPSNAHTAADLDRIYGKPVTFTLWDDDGEKYYTGTGRGEFWESAYQWGAHHAGTTTIRDGRGKVIIG